MDEGFLEMTNRTCFGSQAARATPGKSPNILQIASAHDQQLLRMLRRMIATLNKIENPRVIGIYKL